MPTETGKGLSFYDMTPEQLETVPQAIRDSNWFEAFGYSPFEITEVQEIISVADGEHDADNWVGVFKLKDGRFGYLTAGCDYTGWDCQAGGHGDVRATLDEVIRELCEDDDRKRLGLSL